MEEKTSHLLILLGDKNPSLLVLGQSTRLKRERERDRQLPYTSNESFLLGKNWNVFIRFALFSKVVTSLDFGMETEREWMVMWVIIPSLAILIILCFAPTVDCYNVLTGNCYNFTAAR